MSIFTRAEDHMNMMGEMMRQTDVDLSRAAGPSADQFLRQSIIRCLTCRNGDVCKEWLGEKHEHAAPPAFCPNSGRFREFVAAAE